MAEDVKLRCPAGLSLHSEAQDMNLASVRTPNVCERMGNTAGLSLIYVGPPRVTR